jgi:hypothetical protein
LVPAFHKFYNAVRKKSFLVAILTNFAPRKFLEPIVTADETWESKAQSTAWKRPTSPVAKKFKNQPSASKIRFIHFTPKGETVTNQNYCDMLRTKMKPAISSKRRGKLRKDVILLHNNSRLYTSNQTVKTVN